MQLPLPIASYRLPSPAASSSRLLNVFAEQAPRDSTKGPVILRRAPGIKPWIEIGEGPIRGAILHDQTLYALSGEELYEIAPNGNATAVTGSVAGAERVRMATNGNDIVIVRPQEHSAYHFDGTSVSQISDPVFLDWSASDVAFVDGYFVFVRPGTSAFFNSGLNAVTFNALDFATADGAPDPLISLLVDHRELVLFGTETTEFWYNAARPTGSPFARSPGGLIELGCAAAHSPGKQDSAIYWLASDLTVRRQAGTAPQRVSQHGIEAILQRSTIGDAFALTYSQEGHHFYALQLPNAGRTLVFDTTTGEWHERESLGYGRWRANVLIKAYGMQLVGDAHSGKIGILDPDTHEEWGEPQRVAWTYQPVYAERNRASHRRFEIVFNAGHGVTVGQGQNPLATLKVSDDGGETWRARPTRSLGQMGKYKARAVWWNCGSSRDRVYQIEVTDPVPLFVFDTVLEGEGMRL